MLRLICAVTVALTFGIAFDVSAQTPRHELVIYVPFSPGGATDLVARLTAREFDKAYGIKSTIRNVPSYRRALNYVSRLPGSVGGKTQLIMVPTTLATALRIYDDKLSAVATIAAQRILFWVSNRRSVNELAALKRDNALVLVMARQRVAKLSAIRTFEKLSIPVKFVEASRTNYRLGLQRNEVHVAVGGGLETLLKGGFKSFEPVAGPKTLDYGFLAPRGANAAVLANIQRRCKELSSTKRFSDQLRKHGFQPWFTDGQTFQNNIITVGIDECDVCDCNDDDCKEDCPECKN